MRLIDFGSAQVGYMNLRTAEDRSRAEEDIGKNTTQMYRSPEMIDLYMRDILTEKTDIWVKSCTSVTNCLSSYSDYYFAVGPWLLVLCALFLDAPVSRCRQSRHPQCEDYYPE